MNKKYLPLTEAVEAHASTLRDNDDRTVEQDQSLRLADTLIRFIRFDHCELDHIYFAFGAPGDWGYSTPIGKALQEVYKNG